MWPWDERQQAMLEEMGIRLWRPAAESAPEPDAAVTAAPMRAPVSAPTVERVVEQVIERVVAPSQEQAYASVAADAFVTQASQCEDCALCHGRQHSTAQALPAHQQHWLVVGDPPDEGEDAAGAPLVGDAGVLMDNILRAVGIQRSGAGAQGARVVNVVRCRPPLGQRVLPEHMRACQRYIDAEIAHLQPRVIVALGRYASQALLARNHPQQIDVPLGQLRGQVYRYGDIPLVLSYAPSMLLRGSASKAQAWADWCLAMSVIGR